MFRFKSKPGYQIDFRIKYSANWIFLHLLLRILYTKCVEAVFIYHFCITEWRLIFQQSLTTDFIRVSIIKHRFCIREIIHKSLTLLSIFYVAFSNRSLTSNFSTFYLHSMFISNNSLNLHQLISFLFISLKPFHNKSLVHKIVPLLPNFLTPMTS